MPILEDLNHHIAKDGFRLRGTSMSRLEGFSDVVFGFALTLIVVSLEVPRTYDELHALLLGFVPFAICFVFLISIWWAHFRFFRRYGLEDSLTIILNSLLLFTVLFYVYPLKFLFTLFIGQFTGQDPGHVFSNFHQQAELMVVYGAGFAAIYIIFGCMYWHAWRERLRLHLNPLETVITRTLIWNYMGIASIGILCCVLAVLLPSGYGGYAGFIFWLVGVWKTIHGFISGRAIRAAQARATIRDKSALLPNQS
jgi:uncharacterized membrane protein